MNPLDCRLLVCLGVRLSALGLDLGNRLFGLFDELLPELLALLSTLDFQLSVFLQSISQLNSDRLGLLVGSLDFLLGLLASILPVLEHSLLCLLLSILHSNLILAQGAVLLQVANVCSQGRIHNVVRWVRLGVAAGCFWWLLQELELVDFPPAIASTVFVQCVLGCLLLELETLVICGGGPDLGTLVGLIQGLVA